MCNQATVFLKGVSDREERARPGPTQQPRNNECQEARGSNATAHGGYQENKMVTSVWVGIPRVDSRQDGSYQADSEQKKERATANQPLRVSMLLPLPWSVKRIRAASGLWYTDSHVQVEIPGAQIQSLSSFRHQQRLRSGQQRDGCHS